MFRFFAVFLICIAPMAHAEIIEFDVPGLAGSSADSLQIDSLVYNGPAAVVNAVYIRVTGIVNDLGQICCTPSENCPEDAHDWILAWYGTIERFDDPVYGKWVASQTEYLSQLVAFDQTGVAESHNGFPSMSDGDVFQVGLYFGALGWPDVVDCEFIRPVDGNLYSVTVILDVSTTLPAEHTTWGQMKALFN